MVKSSLLLHSKVWRAFIMELSSFLRALMLFCRWFLAFDGGEISRYFGEESCGFVNFFKASLSR